MEKRRKVSHFCSLLLALLHITTPSSAQNTTTATSTVRSPTTTTTATSTSTSAPSPVALGYRTRPANITVVVGEPAEFRCGVPEDSPSLVFTYYSSHGNYSITCPNGHVEDIAQALYGKCDVKNGELLAVWTLQGTSFSDNDTRVVCQQPNNPDSLTAVLNVYDNGTAFATLIGCTIGAFFGILLVFALSYTMIWRSERCQRCFRGSEREDDMITIVSKDDTKTEEKARKKIEEF
ncbi:hypothetical protein JOB18_016370 [Solea senegalensis]|uniref:Uncharacterized protein n=1 Tax=Solea senegalensis TaxID=28829 RepID=A0AAV6PU32_SOLSE|nr:uncharacterized protein LOC122774230 [Solea senegalensis]KAG7474762.1 hypothetical protein JOB18_016370 [Solea senegalensis]